MPSTCTVVAAHVYTVKWVPQHHLASSRLVCISIYRVSNSNSNNNNNSSSNNEEEDRKKKDKIKKRG
ncbi:hypothetical protein PP707_06265 [Acetobacter pasteurianus]|nr:hypothetical protein [Acetobacter pasteurianus]